MNEDYLNHARALSQTLDVAHAEIPDSKKDRYGYILLAYAPHEVGINEAFISGQGTISGNAKALLAFLDSDNGKRITDEIRKLRPDAFSEDPERNLLFRTKDIKALCVLYSLLLAFNVFWCCIKIISGEWQHAITSGVCALILGLCLFANYRWLRMYRHNINRRKTEFNAKKLSI